MEKYARFYVQPCSQMFCKLAGDEPSGRFHAQPLRQTWDLAKARNWLEICVHCHDSLCNQNASKVPGMNLIDCEDMVIVAANESSRWLALSYVWGASYQASTSTADGGFRAGSRLPADIPGTIRDAISVTKKLRYRYLWVDEYCIDQCNESHRDAQITHMDQIYKGADLTIVAAAGEDKTYGLPGIGSTKRKVTKAVCINNVRLFSNGPDPVQAACESKWFTRAWSFQEGLLSRRLLVFTDHQASFYCSASSWMEGLSCLEPSAAAKSDWTQPFVLSLFKCSWIHISDQTRFEQMVEQYSRRQLTHETDALNAFLGVMHHLRQSSSAVHTLYGLPFLQVDNNIPWSSLDSHVNDSLDSFNRTVACSLSWYPRHDSPDPEFPYPRRSMFPSWTWVGWHGPAKFFHANYSAECRFHARKVQFETSLGGVPNLPTLLQSGDRRSIQDVLDTVTIVQFEAPIISADIILETEVPPKRDVGDSKSPLMYIETLKIAGRHLESWSNPGDAILHDLIENVRQGIWSCLILSGHESVLEHGGFVLVVQWEEDKITAERVGAFVFTSCYDGERPGPLGERLGPLEEQLEWRRVRLR
ncbi:HET-domain-containing protein [Ophiobolus disseminans]|uniref:HET-domain-containing protein n=1 Tax=Ophiobolus disseminans TaxID=1469910 RepID=A0A6A7A7W9_9PLEO|nr:HET-domain-containing protein [Ophiobolus disseminans]